MKNWCVCAHHLDEHHRGACWHILRVDPDKVTYCDCYEYQEDDPDALLTQGALYDP